MKKQILLPILIFVSLQTYTVQNPSHQKRSSHGILTAIQNHSLLLATLIQANKLTFQYYNPQKDSLPVTEKIFLIGSDITSSFFLCTGLIASWQLNKQASHQNSNPRDNNV